MKWPRYPSYKPSGIEWLGEVAEHWEVKRFRRLVRSLDQGSSPVARNEPAAQGDWGVLKLSAVRRGSFDPSENKALEEIDRGPTVTPRAGDLLISRANTLDRVGDVAIVPADEPRRMVPDLLYRVRLRTHVADPSFVGFFLLSRSVRAQIEADARGSSGSMVKLGQGHVRDWFILCPPVTEQREIAAFLQLETERIDTLVAKKRTLIERLEEKRSALISLTVTRGLPPDASRAAGLSPNPRLKPSGIQWLGDVPEHWDLKRIKHLAVVRQGITKGRDLRAKETIEMPYLRVANVQDGYLDLSEIATIEVLPAELERFRLQRGDVLMNEGGDNDKLGRGAVWTGEIDPCLHQNHVFSVRPRDVRTGEWIARWTQGFAAKTYFLVRGKQTTNLASISSSSISDLPLTVPPEPEQHLIVAFLDRETGKIDSMMTKIETAIERLQEYRAALITAAVTGKIDVRAASVHLREPASKAKPARMEA